MALALLDGSNASIDVSIATASYKCIAAAWTARLVREFSEQTTFCSGGWRARVPGMRQLIGSLAGFASKGSAISDPSVNISTQLPVAMVLTADTGSTFTFSGHVGSDETTMVAAANSGRAIAFESTGAVVTAWVVA